NVRKVFLLGSFSTLPEIVTRLDHAGVEHIMLLTSRCVIGGKPDNAVTGMWLHAERVVRDARIRTTVLRPSGFHSNALRWLPQLRHGDVVRAPWPHVPIASIDPADIAAVAATLLTQDDAHHDALELSGPQSLTPGDQVAILSDVLGRPLRYEAIADEEARTQMATDTPTLFIDAFFRFYS